MSWTALAFAATTRERKHANALAPGTVVAEYRLERVLGAGGFGITYLGWDAHLEKHVAIKEYLPAQLAVRALDGSIIPIATEQEHDYAWGLERFVTEARILARFSHPHIVRVNRYVEANGTAYMVMDYEAGSSLSQWLSGRPQASEQELRELLDPILDGLAAVHEQGFLHRDIKPANVYVRDSGSPVLIDFGAARQAIGRHSMSLTSIVSPGYAPIEQYASEGNKGPWSDVYSISAVLYRAVSGENPPDAISRLRADRVPERLRACAARYSAAFIEAILRGMTLDEKSRPQSIREWRDLLGRCDRPGAGHAARTSIVQTRPVTERPAGLTTVQPAIALPAVPANPPSRPRPGRERGSRWATIIGVAAGAAVLTSAAHFRTDVRTAPPASDTVKAAAGTIVPAPTDSRIGVPPAEVPALAVQHDEPGTGRILERPATDLPLRARTGQHEPAEALVSEVQRPPVGSPADVAPAADFTGSAHRVPHAKPKPFAAPPPRPMRAMGAIDTDGDGAISLEEARANMPRLARDFGWADADGNGRISPIEWQRYRRLMP